MGRLIRISIYALIILILYFWITAIVKSYQNKTSNQQVDAISDTLIVDTVTTDTAAFDTHASDTLITNEDIVDGKIDYKALDEKVKVLEETKPQPSASIKKERQNNNTTETKPSTKRQDVQAPKSNQPSNGNLKLGDGGSYKVMAGSYLLKENAQKMVNKLKGLGYTQAEVVVFKASGYHSVIACRHSSEKFAKSAAADLKSRGIDSFVKN